MPMSRMCSCSVHLAGKTPRAAHDAFTHAYQRALLCVTPARFGTDGHRDPEALHSARIGVRSVPLHADPHVRLLVDVQYRIVEEPDTRGSWVVRLEHYAYALRDAEEAELFAYHWHPHARSWITWPHMHLGPALGQLPAMARAAHFPTGPVALRDVLDLIIRWFGVVPRQADWDRQLRETRQLFAELHPGVL